ncbi:hypothetical protein J5TS2_19200 [Brevibacillus halotolerans]|nr:hypothetical protein J5TS2_19200 [Brevibacillus halotolerans]
MVVVAVMTVVAAAAEHLADHHLKVESLAYSCWFNCKQLIYIYKTCMIVRIRQEKGLSTRLFCMPLKVDFSEYAFNLSKDRGKEKEV